MNKRLPTIDEWQELKYNCKWEWDDEKKGMKVIGKNGNNIFLPALGFNDGTGLNFVGSYGDYWSSSHSTVNSYLAYYVFFSSDYVNMDNCYHFYGHPVRPVSDIKEDGFIDLGLPSGLLWAENNIEGYYTYDEAMKLFKDEGIEANDSELKGGTYTIPEGYEAEIKDGEIIVKEKESEDERIRVALCDIVRDMPYMETELRAHGLTVKKNHCLP